MKFSKIIYALKLSSSLAEAYSIEMFISKVLLSGKFFYLVDLDLSYIHIDIKCAYELCKYLNPVVSGYNPLKRLTMTKCGLALKGTQLILDSFSNNNFIEEIYLTGINVIFFLN